MLAPLENHILNDVSSLVKKHLDQLTSAPQVNISIKKSRSRKKSPLNSINETIEANLILEESLIQDLDAWTSEALQELEDDKSFLSPGDIKALEEYDLNLEKTPVEKKEPAKFESLDSFNDFVNSINLNSRNSSTILRLDEVQEEEPLLLKRAFSNLEQPSLEKESFANLLKQKALQD